MNPDIDNKELMGMIPGEAYAHRDNKVWLLTAATIQGLRYSLAVEVASILLMMCYSLPEADPIAEH